MHTPTKRTKRHRFKIGDYVESCNDFIKHGLVGRILEYSERPAGYITTFTNEFSGVPIFDSNCLPANPSELEKLIYDIE